MRTISYEVHEDSCGVCGERPLAMVRVRDIWEIPPDPGSGFTKWEASDFHYFCPEHARPSLQVRLDRTILTDPQQAAQHEDMMRRFERQASPAPLPDDIIKQQIAALEGWALGCQDIERRKAGAA